MAAARGDVRSDEAGADHPASDEASDPLRDIDTLVKEMTNQHALACMAMKQRMWLGEQALVTCRDMLESIKTEPGRVKDDVLVEARQILRNMRDTALTQTALHERAKALLTTHSKQLLLCKDDLVHIRDRASAAYMVSVLQGEEDATPFSKSTLDKLRSVYDELQAGRDPADILRDRGIEATA